MDVHRGEEIAFATVATALLSSPLPQTKTMGRKHTWYSFAPLPTLALFLGTVSPQHLFLPLAPSLQLHSKFCRLHLLASRRLLQVVCTEMCAVILSVYPLQKNSVRRLADFDLQSPSFLTSMRELPPAKVFFTYVLSSATTISVGTTWIALY